MALTNSVLYLMENTRGSPGASGSGVDRPREMNRYMGGARRFTQPHVSGYWYLLIEPPHRLFGGGHNVTGGAVTNEGGNSAGGANAAFEASRWLHSTAEGFTPPTRTLTKVDVPALGGVGSSFVAGQQLTRTFTTTFREYQDTPIFNTINRWTSMIDHHYGVSSLEGAEFIPANYKGNAYIFLCKPTVTGGGNKVKETASGDNRIDKIDVEQFYFFEGVFPESAPYDAFNSDINTNDIVQLSVTWSFDGWPYGREHEDAFATGIEKLTRTYDFNFEGTHKNHIEKGASTFGLPVNSSSGAIDN